MVQQDKEKPVVDFEDQPPLQPPSSGKKSMFSIGGENIKIVVISFLVTLVILFLMSFAGGIFFITKKDFTTNMANVVTTMEQAKAGLAIAQSNVATAIQGIASTITNQVNSSVSQATSQWSSQLASLSGKVDTLSGSLQGLNTQISQLITETDSLSGEIATLKTDKSALEAKITALETKVTTLEAKALDYEKRIKALEGTPSTPTETPSGTVVASYYNSPMYWTTGLPGIPPERSFGLKISNGTDKNLIYVDMTITLQSSFPLSYFIANPTLITDSGILWEYSPGIGNVFRFDGKGYIYVQAKGEFSGLQKLTINTGSYTGTYTISVSSVVINSKILQ